jgi:hypothetical protein
MNAIFIGIEDNAINTTNAYAESDLSSLSPEEIRQQAKDYFSTLIEVRNQSNTDTSSLANEVSTMLAVASRQI